MLKKTMVLFLSMLLILSCIPGVGVYAENTVNISTTEDFEDGAVDSTYFDNTLTNATIVDGVGKNGSKGLKISADATGALNTKQIAMTSAERGAISFDFMLTKEADTPSADTNYFNLAQKANGFNCQTLKYRKKADGSNKVVVLNDEIELELNKWYRMAVANVGCANLFFYVIDENGNAKRERGYRSLTEDTREYNIIAITKASKAEMVIDNIDYSIKTSESFGPKLTYSSVANNATEVSSNTKSMDVRFDSPFFCQSGYTQNLSGVTLTPEGGTAINCTVTPKVNYYTTLDYTVSWTAALEKGKKYTLDFSGVTSTDVANATGTVTFTTEEEAKIINNIIVAEDFEDGAIDTTYFDNTITSTAVVDGLGRDGSKALKISANATGAFNTKQIALETTDRATLAFDFKMTKAATAGTEDKVLAILANIRNTAYGHSVRIKKLTDNGDKIMVSSSNEYSLETGKWYRAAIVTEGSGQAFYYVINDEGQLYRHEFRGVNPSNLFYNIFSVSSASDAEFLIDNINYTIKTYDTHGPVLAHSTIKNNATGVPTTTKSMKVSFDSPFEFARAWTNNWTGATITPEGGSAINCTMTRIAEWGTNLDYVVSWSADLEKGKKYTVDFSNTANTSGAKGSGSITFTTTEPTIEESTVKDAFENDSYFNNGLYGNGSTTGTSDFVSNNYWSFSGVNKTTGYTGNGAVITKSEATSNTGLFTRNLYTVGENEKMVFNFRMKIKDAEIINGESGYSGGNSVSFGIHNKWGKAIYNQGYIARVELDTFAGKHYIGENTSAFVGSSAAGRMGYYYKENNWYNIYWTLTQGEMEFIMVDDTTGEIVYKTVKKGTYTDSYGFTLGQMTKADTATNNGTEIVLDDLAIWKINSTKAENKTKIVSDFTQNAEINKNTDSVVIEFNQPVLAERSGIEIFEGDECAVNTFRTPYVTYPDFKKIKLDFSNLEYASTYTADFGGITSVGGAAMEDNTATLTFKTAKDATKAISVIGGIEGANFTGSGVLRDTVLSVTINNNTDSTIDSIRLFAAVYSTGGDLIGIESADSLQSAVVGRDTAEITFDKDYEDAMKIKLFVWNDFSGITPLAETEETYGGATEVLMIGNSLSEDASKYLHEMAQADGNDKLNLTVAYIGGSSIDHHYANFKNELENENYEQLDGNARDTYYMYENGESVGRKYPKITELLKSKRFDIITLQEYCFNMYSYDKEDISDITYIVSQIRKLQPNAKIMLYECWAKNTTTKSGRNMHYLTQIAPWYKKVAKELELEIIPSGRAFNLAQESDAEDEGFNTPTSVIGNTNAGEQDTTTIASFSGLYRDADHASLYGRYLTDAVIYEAITGKRVSESFDMEKPDGISDEVHAERISELRDFAHKAILEFK